MMNLQRLEHWLTEISTRSWFHYGLLLLITLLAAALRFYKLGEWSFWIDEIFTINHATRHFGTPQLILANIPPVRNWVPISVILTAQSLKIFGITEWSARLTSAFIGIITFPILYFPTKKLFGNRVALLGLLLLSVSPWHIFWSQNARFYTTLMLLYSLALFAFYFGIEEDNPKYLALFFLLVYFAASERLSALLIFPVVVFYFFALWIMKFERPRGLNFRNLLIVALPILIGGFIELYSRIVKGESRFFGDFNWFFQYQIDDPFRLLVFIGNNIGISLMVMAIFSGLFILSKRSRLGLLILISSIGPLFILLLANTFIFTKDRYLFITLFSWLILTGIGINEIMSISKGNLKWLTVGFTMILVTTSLNDSLLYFQANHGNRLQWKSAFSTVQEQAGEKDTIVSYWPEFSSYYINHEIIAYRNIDLESILESDTRHWFILDSETIWLNYEVKVWLENNAELINVWYLRRPEDNFLRLYLYDPARTHDPYSAD